MHCVIFSKLIISREDVDLVQLTDFFQVCHFLIPLELTPWNIFSHLFVFSRVPVHLCIQKHTVKTIDDSIVHYRVKNGSVTTDRQVNSRHFSRTKNSAGRTTGGRKNLRRCQEHPWCHGTIDRWYVCLTLVAFFFCGNVP